MLVIKILEECGFGSVLKRFLKETSLIDEYKQEKIEKIGGISLNVVRKIAMKCIKKCRSIDAHNVTPEGDNEDYGDKDSIPVEPAGYENYSHEIPKKKVKKINNNRKMAETTLIDNTYWNNKSNDYATKAAMVLENVSHNSIRLEENNLEMRRIRKRRVHGREMEVSPQKLTQSFSRISISYNCRLNCK